jgi:hypothetical protein
MCKRGEMSDVVVCAAAAAAAAVCEGHPFLQLYALKQQ